MQLKTGWMSLGNQFNILLDTPYPIVGTPYYFSCGGVETVIYPPTGQPVTGVYGGVFTSACLTNCSGSVAGQNMITIGYFPTINAYCIEYGWPTNVRWIVGPSLQTSVALRPTTSTVLLAGKRYQELSPVELVYSYSMAQLTARWMRPMAPAPASQACQMATIDLFVAAFIFVAAAIAIAGAAPALGLGALAAGALLGQAGGALVFGAGVYAFTRAFQQQADACANSSPPSPVLKPNFGGQSPSLPNYLGSVTWGQTTGAPSDDPTEVPRRQAPQ